VNKLAKDLGGKCYNVFLILSGINELGLILLKINITNMKYKILYFWNITEFVFFKFGDFTKPELSN
jgi:hypothetical protein